MTNKFALQVEVAAMWLVLFAVGVGEAVAAQPAPAPGPAHVVLGNTSVWRSHFVTRKPVVRVGRQGRNQSALPLGPESTQDCGKTRANDVVNDIQELGFHSYGGVWKAVEGGKDLLPTIESAAPPTNWTAADFDDRSWTPQPGPFFPSHHGHAYCKQVEDAGYLYFEGTWPTLATICLRGKFRVADPATAGELKLTLAYRGGVVVYLNGREIARAHLPAADKGLETLAEDYPREVFVKDNGKLISWGFGDPQSCHAQLQQRIRRLRNVTVPARFLRPGINVLAIEAHRAPYHASLLGPGRGTKGYEINWCPVGVTRVELTGTGPGVTPNVSRPAAFQVWNQDVDRRVTLTDYGDPCETLRPMRLVAARNSRCSGAVVVGATAPLQNLKAVVSGLSVGRYSTTLPDRPGLQNLKAVVSGLKGRGTIPAAAMEVRYALPDKEADLAFEILAPAAPAAVPVDKAGGAVLPVWVTAKVPADAQPGDYRGTLSIAADGVGPVAVPIALHVVDWTMPESKDFRSHVGLTQSPESVALRYQVPLWSPEHWRLLEKSFALLGQAGADDVFITALRRTHFGNEHGMIRWVKQPGGTLKPDLSIAEQYLDLAIKHLGKVPVVCLYCWEPFTGALYGGAPAKTGNKGMPFTIVDPATGKLEAAEGPKWGTPAVREFWQPVFDGLREILAKRGMERALMVGVAGDAQPSKAAVEDLRAVAPTAPWVVQAHARVERLFDQPVGYLADVWGSPIAPDPAQQRLCGWNMSFLRTTFPREGSSTVMAIRTWSPLAQHRVALEGMSAAGLRGLGRMGADFWDVLEVKDPLRSTYSHSLNILGRYPESNWAQLYVGNTTPYILAAGPDGALPTVRFEMLREGAQDLEARIFLENALLNPELRDKLGADLAQRCQQLLDDRVRAVLRGRTSWLLFAGGPERLERLYTLAGEVAGKLGRHTTRD